MISVRPARDEELDAVAELLLEAFAEHLGGDDVPEVAAYRREIVDVRSRLDVGRLLVAEAHGAVVGAVTLLRPGHPPWPSGWATIRLLAVRPTSRGLGIGRALTQACLVEARAMGATDVGLHTAVQMGVARGLYQRMGFFRVPALDAWPAPGVHAEAYRLPLSG